MTSTDSQKITMPDGERWMRLRGKGRRFKAGERRKLYETYDSMTGGPAIKELTLVRYMAAHLIEDWSLELPRPQAVMKDGDVIYEHMASLDELDCDMEDELLAYAAGWVKQIAINFAATRDPESPTPPSGA